MLKQWHERHGSTRRGWRDAFLASTALITLIAAPLARAADADAPAPSGQTGAGDIEEVTVSGVRASIRGSIERKRDSANEVDSIEAEGMGRFPDNNLAEALQRVPGVSLERSSVGDSRTLTVRGLSSQFTRVEINGMEAPTGGGGRSDLIEVGRTDAGDGRSFNFAFLPSELFTSAVVSKTPQAHDDEGGIAAIVKLSTPSPAALGPESFTVGTFGTASKDADTEPRVYMMGSKQLNSDWAVLAGIVYSRVDSQTSQEGFSYFRPLSAVAANPAALTPQQASAYVPTQAGLIDRNRYTENTAALGSVEWTPADWVDLQFDAVYTRGLGDERFDQNYIDMSSGVATPSNLQMANGVAVAGQFPAAHNVVVSVRSDEIDDRMQMYSLHGTVKLDDHWSAQPFMGWNNRQTFRPYHELDFSPTGGNFSYALTGDRDNFSTSATNFATGAQNLYLRNVYRSQNQNASTDWDNKLDAVGDYDFGFPVTFRLGIRYDDNRSSVDEPFRGQLNTGSGISLASLGGSAQQLDLPGSGNHSILDLQNLIGTYTHLLNGQDLLSPAFKSGATQLNSFVIGSALSDQLASSRVTESTTGGYFETEATIGGLVVNPGVRVISTHEVATGTQSVNNVNTPVKNTQDYTDVLPSINVKYEVLDDVFLRGAGSRALSRPSLQALSPRETFNYNTLIGSRGNPDLKPFTVDQFDLGAEWYVRKETLLAATYFEKNFSSLVVDQTVVLPRMVTTSAGANVLQDITFTQPVNSGSGSVKGVELIAQSNIFFAPKWADWLKSAGVLFNYTHLSSEASISTSSSTQQQPFPNLSPSSLNAQLYYDDGIVDARLNYAWQQGYLRDGLDPNGNFVRQGDFGQLDITVDYNLTSNLTLQVQANNVLGEQMKFYSSSKDIYASLLTTPASVLFGMRYKL